MEQALTEVKIRRQKLASATGSEPVFCCEVLLTETTTAPEFIDITDDVADIVADSDVPPKVRADGELWGECIAGALTEEALLAELERAGFHGISILKKTFWRELEGCRFYSVTTQAFKFEKKAGCTYLGQWATYLGPMKATIDDEGHLFPRGVPVQVCTDTAAKLTQSPYAGSFVVADQLGEQASADVSRASCGPGLNCC